MVRHTLLFIAVLGALASAEPVAAQFGTIFGGPPRPPADIPERAPGGDDRYYSAQPPQGGVWPRQPQAVPRSYPQDQQGYPPPPPGYPARGFPQDQPGYPPQQAGRPPGGYQQQELPPPPGATAAPPPTAALPGLPPGQRQPRVTPGAPSGAPGETPATPAPPNDEVVIQPPAQKIPNAAATFSGLDKITGRIIAFDVALNETVQFGALQVTPRVCYTRPPTETSNTDAFIEVDEITLQGEIKRIFTGWIFAASPGLHAVEHPIYDVWLADCKGPQAATVAAADPVTPAAQPAVQRTKQAAPQQPPRPKQAAPQQAAPQQGAPQQLAPQQLGPPPLLR
jgi:hypothetical protein